MLLPKTKSLVKSPSKKIKLMLEKAVQFIDSPKDPTHGVEHVKSLLKNADKFLNDMRGKFKVNKKVLLLAIYWHDVWKSQNKPTLANYLIHQIYEGYGSMFIFQKHAKLFKLPKEITSEVSYAIRKHSAVQIFPTTTLEAKILWDIDTIDVWNPDRFKMIFKNLKNANLSIFDSSVLYMKTVGFYLNFDWTKRHIEKMKPKFFRELETFRKTLVTSNISN